MAFDHLHYVPVLLTKRGERRGVGDLTDTVKRSLTPLFVVPPVDWDYDNSAPAKHIDAHLASVAKDLRACWGTQRAFLDPYFLEGSERMATGRHPLEFLIEQGNQEGAQLLPCVSTQRDTDYRAAAAAIHARDRRGVCIRLGPAEWPSATGGTALNDLLKDLALTPANVDLILDVVDEVIGSPNVTAAAMRTELATLPYVSDWRSLTVASAGFPSPPLQMSKGLSTIDREDWYAYSTLVTGPPLPRIPTFADYAIANPYPVVDVDPKMMSISASFRYTIDKSWIFAKGELFKGRAGSGLGGAAMLPLARTLTADPRFAGGGHCAGDKWIEAQAIPGGGTGGNPETWRRAGTTHHLTHVISEIANLHGPSGGGAPLPAIP